MARRVAKRLTELQIKKAKAPGVLADGDGLQLLVTSGGAKRWVLLLQVHGRRRKLGLGLYPGVSLEEARQKTQAHRSAVRAGSPLPSHREMLRTKVAARAEVTAGLTVKQTFALFWPIRRARLRNPKHVAQWEATLATYAFPAIGGRPVAEVKAGEIIDLLRPIWRSKSETASRVLQRLTAIFQFAIVRGDRERANPCSGVAEILGRERRGDREQHHHRAMPYADVPSFMKALGERSGYASTRLAFEFLVLTAARSGEVRGACWSETDLDNRLWTVPASRMKGGREHRVPLSDRAMAIVTEAKALGSGRLIFPGTKGQPLSDMTLTKVLRDMGLGDMATAHGFRTTFKTWCSETGVADLVSEAALAHTDRNRVRAAYNRTDYLAERRTLMAKWAEHCRAICG